MKLYFYIFIIFVFVVNFMFLIFGKKKIDKIVAFINISNSFILTIFLFSDFQKFSILKLIFSLIFILQIGVVLKIMIDNLKEV